MTTVALRNGDVVNKERVSCIYSHLKNLEKTNYVALWDLAMKCQNSSHRMIPTLIDDSEEILKGCTLLSEDGTIPEDIRIIVINSVENINQIDITLFLLQDPLAVEVVSTNEWSWCSIL